MRAPLRSDLEERLQKRLGTRVDVQKGAVAERSSFIIFPEELDGVVEQLLNG